MNKIGKVIKKKKKTTVLEIISAMQQIKGRRDSDRWWESASNFCTFPSLI